MKGILSLFYFLLVDVGLLDLVIFSKGNLVKTEDFYKGQFWITVGITSGHLCTIKIQVGHNDPFNKNKK